MKNYYELKSGTDIRGYASDIFGNTVNLTDSAVKDLTAGFICFLSEKCGKAGTKLKVSVGHDSRITAENIKKNVVSSLLNFGVTVMDCGLASTPAMFMTTVTADCDGAVQITASHHPADRNGLKFFLPDGGLNSTDIDKIIEFAVNGIKPPVAGGHIIVSDYMSEYSALLRKKICDELNTTESSLPLKGFRIVVDAGNGAGGFYAKEILERLGADTSGSVYLEPDGMFPNHIPNPENEKAMESICSAVKQANADLGVIFDTDVDRAACVGSDGCEINRNKLIALASSIVIENNPGATIVTDSVTSDGLKKFIEVNLGGKHHRFKRGYKNVIDEAKRLCAAGINSPLAIETSGHAALKENYFLDDGAYLITKIIIKMVKSGRTGMTISDIISDMEVPLDTKELRFDIKTSDFRQYGESVIHNLKEYCESDSSFKIAPDNYEGLRVNVNDGWFLLRLSVHDPNMPMNIESSKIGGAKKIAEKIAPFFNKCKELDSTSLTDFLSE